MNDWKKFERISPRAESKHSVPRCLVCIRISSIFMICLPRTSSRSQNFHLPIMTSFREEVSAHYTHSSCTFHHSPSCIHANWFLFSVRLDVILGLSDVCRSRVDNDDGESCIIFGAEDDATSEFGGRTPAEKGSVKSEKCFLCTRSVYRYYIGPALGTWRRRCGERYECKMNE